MITQYGDNNDIVRELQAALNFIAGVWNRPDFNVGAEDGVFGSHTQTGVSNYQMAAGLPNTGIADDTTWTALGYTVNVFTDGFKEINWSNDPTPTQRNDNFSTQAISAGHKTKIHTIITSPYPSISTSGIDWKMIGIIAAIALGLVFINMGGKKR